MSYVGPPDNLYPPTSCRVFWGTHGCDLPRGHEGWHICGLNDPDGPCGLVRPDGLGFTRGYLTADEDDIGDFGQPTPLLIFGADVEDPDAARAAWEAAHPEYAGDGWRRAPAIPGGQA